MTIAPKNERLRRDIGVCLEVTDSLIPYLVPREVFSGVAGELDKDVKNSAEATFHNVTTKLDALIASLGNYASEELIEKKILDHADALTAAQRESALTSQNLRRPSVIYQPIIGRHPSGSWCAFYGDVNDEEASIIGVGKTVEEAMLDFDREWTKKEPAARQTTQTPKTDTSKGRKSK